MMFLNRTFDAPEDLHLLRRACRSPEHTALQQSQGEAIGTVEALG